MWGRYASARSIAALRTAVLERLMMKLRKALVRFDGFLIPSFFVERDKPALVRSEIIVLMPRFDPEPFARSEGFNVIALRCEPYPAAALFLGADSQISDCCLHREVLL
jgi:hypothetical protein